MGWYNEKVMDWRQMIAWESDAVPEPKKTKLANAVLLVPPLNPDKKQLDADLLIEQPDMFDRSALERFFDTIDRNKAEA